jgi:hypothetical protein
MVWFGADFGFGVRLILVRRRRISSRLLSRSAMRRSCWLRLRLLFLMLIRFGVGICLVMLIWMCADVVDLDREMQVELED